MLYIRPVYQNDVLLSLALCKTNGHILVDQDIVCHFDKNDNGKMIKDSYPDRQIEWGKPLEVK